MAWFPYIFPVDAWQYPGGIHFEGPYQDKPPAGFRAGLPAWVADLVNSRLSFTTEKPNRLHLGSLALEEGEWLVRQPTGDLAKYSDENFKQLFVERTPVGGTRPC